MEGLNNAHMVIADKDRELKLLEFQKENASENVRALIVKKDSQIEQLEAELEA